MDSRTKPTVSQLNNHVLKIPGEAHAMKVTTEGAANREILTKFPLGTKAS